MVPAPQLPRLQSTEHIAALDGVRALAILLVLQGHTFGVGWVLAGPESALWVDRIALSLSRAGWIGVDLFFVLSGFLITGILLDSRDSPSYFRSFYARRTLRIFPLYWGFLAMVLLIPRHRIALDFSSVAQHPVVYFTYLINLCWTIRPMEIPFAWTTGHFWSLAVEEQFYLVWPFAVRSLGRTRLVIVCWALVVACPLLRALLVSGMLADWVTLQAANMLMPARMDSFAVGALVAVAARTPGVLERVARRTRVAVPLLVGGLVALFVRYRLRALAPWVATVGFSLLALLFAWLIASTLTAAPGSLRRRVFEHRWLRFLGRYAYGLYVFHVPLAYWLGGRVRAYGGLAPLAGSHIPAGIAFFVVAGGLSVGVAWLSWQFYESPLLRLKRFFPYEAKPVTSARLIGQNSSTRRREGRIHDSAGR